MSDEPRHEFAEADATDGSGDHDGLLIVGIGTSAGGLGALRTFFSLTPLDSGMAYVVVAHLSPDFKSHMAELLQPHSTIPIEQVSATTKLEPNRAYVIPPNANLNTIDTHLRLSELEPERRARAPIDHFFRTLASAHDGRAIGIILTGTGTDGTLGLRHVKEAGGLTIVQDPAEAEHDGMPRSAIMSGAADLVLPLERIPHELAGFARTRPQVSEPVSSAPLDGQTQLLQKIFTRVRAQTGHDFSRYKTSTILRRIGRRMQMHQIESLHKYLELLREHKDEPTDLFNDLLITVTEFFRDTEVFDAISEKVAPALFAEKGPQDSIRVWSVGCSTGEEAYSLAMVLSEQAARFENPPRIQIFASDLHDRSLAMAREGIYPAEIAACISQDRLDRFFHKENGHYRIRRDLREMVVFAAHDLLRDPPFAHLDLVVSRNVLIYLQREAQHDVMNMFHYALKPGGWLVLGTSENADRSDLFAIEDKENRIFRRRNLGTRESRLPSFPLVSRGPWIPHDRDERSIMPPNYGLLHEAALERYAPPSVLVDHNFDIMHASRTAGEYLRLPGGEPTRSLFRLIIEPLRIELRTTFSAARDSEGGARSKAVRVLINGQSRSIVIRVHQTTDPELSGHYLVLFDRVDGLSVLELDNSGLESSTDSHAAELEAELNIARQRMQLLIDEHESNREEMQAANEELQSANEELRSTLEELETSKEELQSMNEELITLNQENRLRVEELDQLASDLQNLMASTQIATLFLDRQLRIVRFTPQVSELFNVRPSDRGRPLADLTNKLGYVEIEEHAHRVLETLIPIEHEVQGNGDRWYLARVTPYRTSDDRIEGVVVTLLDITDRKSDEEHLRFMMAELNHRVKNTLAIVSAMADQTLDQYPQPQSFVDRFRQRLRSLSEAHRLLTRSDWRGASLKDLIQSELRTRIRSEQQLILEGPDLLLRPDPALAMHMIVHELATNAIKHGSLSSADGSVLVRWRITHTDAKPTLTVVWEERDGPRVEPPTDDGFGLQMIELTLSHQLDGQCQFDARASGVRWSLSIPWDAQVGSASGS